MKNLGKVLIAVGVLVLVTCSTLAWVIDSQEPEPVEDSDVVVAKIATKADLEIPYKDRDDLTAEFLRRVEWASAHRRPDELACFKAWVAVKLWHYDAALTLLPPVVAEEDERYHKALQQKLDFAYAAHKAGVYPDAVPSREAFFRAARYMSIYVRPSQWTGDPRR